MKASRTVLLTVGFASGVAAALLVLVLILGWEHVSLRARLDAAQEQLRRLSAEREHWQNQQQLAESRLSEQQRKVDLLQSELATLREGRATNPPPAGTRVHVFAQGRYLGSGWLDPRGPGAQPKLTVHLPGPETGASGDTPPRGATAVTAFSVAHHYPSWPWLWVSGWVVGEATNHTAGLPGPGPRGESPTSPSAPPPANPPPPADATFSARGPWPTGLLKFRPEVLRTVPGVGRPGIVTARPLATPVGPGLVSGTTPEPVTAVSKPAARRTPLPGVDRPPVRR